MLSTDDNNQIGVAAQRSRAPDDSSRMTNLSYEQLVRLNKVMNEKIKIYGRGNFPTLKVSFRELVEMVRNRLRVQFAPEDEFSPFSMDPPVTPLPDAVNKGCFRLRSIRLNGGATSHVLTTDVQHFNDLDLIFNISLSGDRDFNRVKSAVLRTLLDLLPEQASRKRMTPWIIKEGYVSKMVKVDKDGDRWSLISLGTLPGKRIVELKFVDQMKRPFEFSVDSFQIVLDSLLLFYGCTSGQQINESFYPTVVCESVYGNFNEAMYHLKNKMIVTRNPEEIRGGGLLKYCNLVLRNFKLSTEGFNLERYMCSRFFIDFPDISQVRSKLENYLLYHFCAPEEHFMKIQYLNVLKQVVKESTIAEKHQMLSLIYELTYQLMSNTGFNYYYEQPY